LLLALGFLSCTTSPLSRYPLEKESVEEEMGTKQEN